MVHTCLTYCPNAETTMQSSWQGSYLPSKENAVPWSQFFVLPWLSAPVNSCHMLQPFRTRSPATSIGQTWQWREQRISQNICQRKWPCCSCNWLWSPKAGSNWSQMRINLWTDCEYKQKTVPSVEQLKSRLCFRSVSPSMGCSRGPVYNLHTIYEAASETNMEVLEQSFFG